MTRTVAALVAVALTAGLAAAPADAGRRHRKARVEHRAAAMKPMRAVAFPLRARPRPALEDVAAGAGPVAGTPPAAFAPAPAAGPASPPPPGPPPLPPPDRRAVSVALTEYALTLSQPSVDAGEVRLQADNSRAEDPHELTVRRADGAVVTHFGDLRPGDVASRTVSLAPGTYELLCPLPAHEEAGMQVALRVAATQR